MIPLMSVVVLGLTMFVVRICYGLTCDQLPKVEVPSIEVLVGNSPFEFDFSLTSTFDHSTYVITKPARGTTNYHGNVYSITGTHVIAYGFAVGGDNKTLHVTSSCGEKSTWHVAAREFDNNGCFLCVYTCNGTALAEFVCYSNNDQSSPNELKAAIMAVSVSNGQLIHDAKQTQPIRNGCQVF